MAESPSSSRSWLARAAATAGPVKALAGAAAAVIGPARGRGARGGPRRRGRVGRLAGAWISLRLVLRGVEGTRFAWAVLEGGTNDVAFTSADVGASAAGPPPSASDTPVQADVWVPFPSRLGRYVVAVSLLPEADQRFDEYVRPPFRVASLPGGGAR